MNASLTDRRNVSGAKPSVRTVGGTLATLACLLPFAGGCQNAVPTDRIVLFEREAVGQPIPPSELDHAVADLVAAALAGTAGQRSEALARIEAQHDERSMKQARLEGRPEMRGLLPLCVDLVNSTLDDPQEYRRASKQALRLFAATPDPPTIGFTMGRTTPWTHFGGCRRLGRISGHSCRRKVQMSGLLQGSWEHALEVFYNFSLTPAVHLTLNTQVIRPAVSFLGTAFSLGGRLQLDF